MGRAEIGVRRAASRAPVGPLADRAATSPPCSGHPPHRAAASQESFREIEAVLEADTDEAAQGEPENALHHVVRNRLESFRAAARERGASGGGLPASSDFRADLDCCIFARGSSRLRCPDCGLERLVAFSCKAHLCPSCNARRMEDTADHLVVNDKKAGPATVHTYVAAIKLLYSTTLERPRPGLELGDRAAR